MNKLQRCSFQVSTEALWEGSGEELQLLLSAEQLVVWLILHFGKLRAVARLPSIVSDFLLSYFFSLQQKGIEFAYVTNEENFTNSSATMRSLSYKKIQCFNIFNELTLST